MSPKSVPDMFKRIFPHNRQFEETANAYPMTPGHPTIPEASNEDADENPTINDLNEVHPGDIMLPNEGRLSNCFDSKPLAMDNSTNQIHSLGKYASFYHNSKNATITLPSRLSRALDVLVKRKRSKHVTDHGSHESDFGKKEFGEKQNEGELASLMAQLPSISDRVSSTPAESHSAVQTPIHASNSTAFPLSVSVSSVPARFPDTTTAALTASSFPNTPVNSDAAAMSMSFSMPATATSATTARFPSFTDMVSTSMTPTATAMMESGMSSALTLPNTATMNAIPSAHGLPSLMSASTLPGLSVDTSLRQSTPTQATNAGLPGAVSYTPDETSAPVQSTATAVTMPVPSLGAIAAAMPLEAMTPEKPQIDTTPTQPMITAAATSPAPESTVVAGMTSSTMAPSNALTINTQSENTATSDLNARDAMPGEFTPANAEQASSAVVQATQEPNPADSNPLMTSGTLRSSPQTAKKVGMTLKRLRSIFKAPPPRRERQEPYARSMLGQKFNDIDLPLQTPLYNKFAKYRDTMTSTLVQPHTPDLSPVAYDLRTTCNQIFFGRW